MAAGSARRDSPPGAAVAPGNHDGVHVGHRALLRAARAWADGNDGATTAALFFSPHPAEVLTPARAPTPLTTEARRRELLLRAGADRALAVPFDEAFAALSATDFAKDILVRDLGAQHVIVGPDFRFGHRAEGDVAQLGTLGATLGFTVNTVPPIERLGERVSSTRIRQQLREGLVETAAELLARYHDVDGLVVLGDRRGRTIGFPTANLEADAVLLPADGVYAVAVRQLEPTPGQPWCGVANLGVRPTANAGRSFEVHLLDFDGDLYGSVLRVAFVARVRPERRFGNLEELKAQITRDTHAARRYIEGAEKDWLSWL